MEKVKLAQKSDKKLCDLPKDLEKGKKSELSMDKEGVLRYEERLCVPNEESIRR